MNKLLITIFFITSSLFASTCVPQSGSAKNVADLNDRTCSTEQFTVGTGGVTVNTLVITDSSNPTKIIAGTGTGAYGIATATVSAAGIVNIQRYGQFLCVMDNNATAGDLVISGTTTPINCKDSGQTASSAISISTRIIGILLTSASSGSTALVELTPAHYGTLTSIANGTATLGTSAIASGACASVVTVVASGITTSDDIVADFNADPTSTTGYAPSANGMLVIFKYPTSGNVNFKVCNNTASSITPGAITLNWRVNR